jgi:hypothetical protein
MHQTTIPSGLLSHILLTQAVRQKQVVAGDRRRSAMKRISLAAVVLGVLIAATVVMTRFTAAFQTPPLRPLVQNRGIDLMTAPEVCTGHRQDGSRIMVRVVREIPR